MDNTAAKISENVWRPKPEMTLVHVDFDEVMKHVCAHAGPWGGDVNDIRANRNVMVFPIFDYLRDYACPIGLAWEIEKILEDIGYFIVVDNSGHVQIPIELYNKFRHNNVRD